MRTDAEIQRAVMDAAMHFASDYGPLAAALRGDTGAQLQLAVKLRIALRKQGLGFAELDTTIPAGEYNG